MAANSIDLEKVQEAMDWLAETDGGDEALKALSDAFDTLRSKIPTKLNNAEVKFILERLTAQRSLVGWNEEADFPEVSGFSMQSLGSLFPQQTGIKRAAIPTELRSSVRVLNYGFVIKAAIPEAAF